MAIQHGIRAGQLGLSDIILALNAGSSSLKFGLFAPEEQSSRLNEIAAASWKVENDPAAIDRVLEWVDGRIGVHHLSAVGHRIVHGGSEFVDPVEIDDNTLCRLEALAPLAPLHQPAGLAPVQRIRALRPQLRQFACFDTAFHRTIVPPASRYALPRRFESEGIRRYGFHGLSYQSIAEQLRLEGAAEREGRPSRIIVAHLGNGASLCAMLGLVSIDTTMGFSVLDGLVMGTRAGALDPGILLYLLRAKHMSTDQLEHLLYRESGLLGVSGISSDVAELLASNAVEAADALELFTFQVAKQATGLAMSLGGLDRIVFTGGIGEHAPSVRAMIVKRLYWLGADLDTDANVSGQGTISSDTSAILLEWRTTQEERAIALNTLACARRQEPLGLLA